tara:strand:- start:147 stop:707 length:561 start_codon:yes stop_codon:yes gene_type:complete
MKTYEDYTNYTCEFINEKTGKVCGEPACRVSKKRKDGTHAPRTRKDKITGERLVCCAKCLNDDIYKNAGYEGSKGYVLHTHPYLKFRKGYCENIDGRLGFNCTFTPPTPKQLSDRGVDEDFKGWLEVDHIDGNHLNNDPKNLQTLCSCCHSVKTSQYKDYRTPGRKTRISSIKKINGKETYLEKGV